MDLQTILKENKKRYNQFLKEQKEFQLKKQKRETIITTFIVIALLFITLFSLNLMTKNAQKKCVNAEHTTCNLLKN